MIVLMRHGQSLEAKGKAIGRTDIPLDEIGTKQATEASKSLNGFKFDKIISSPMKRTMQTAEIICKNTNQSFVTDERIQEINLGDWDGLPFPNIKNNYKKEFIERGKNPYTFCPPNGESFNDVISRTKPAILEIAKKNNSALIVTHAGVINSIVADILQIPAHVFFNLKTNNCHFTILTYGNNELKLYSYNNSYNSILNYFNFIHNK